MITADLAITYSRSSVAEFTTPFSFAPMIFMIPYPELDSTTNRIIKPFQYQVKGQQAQPSYSNANSA